MSFPPFFAWLSIIKVDWPWRIIFIKYSFVIGRPIEMACGWWLTRTAHTRRVSHYTAPKEENQWSAPFCCFFLFLSLSLGLSSLVYLFVRSVNPTPRLPALGSLLMILNNLLKAHGSMNSPKLWLQFTRARHWLSSQSWNLGQVCFLQPAGRPRRTNAPR